MTPEERVAAEALANEFLQHLVVAVVLIWWTVWAWKKLKLPGIDLARYWTWEPREVSRVAPKATDHYAKLDEENDQKETPENQQETITETRNNGVAMSESERYLLFRQGQAKALAKLIEAAKVTETEGLKIVYGVNPGSSAAYRDVRALLKEAQAPEYPTLTQDGRPVARHLRTGAKRGQN